MLTADGLMVFYENMLALNNLSLRCEEGQVVGVFGANSAGKSTLMYTLSGIILDIRHKEKMRGGERISLFGEVRYRGEAIGELKANQRARRGMERFVEAAHGLLRSGGWLWLVANRHLPYGPVIRAAFPRAEVVSEDPRYRVWRGRKA